ncbi:MAG TPA: amino acid ABC transporter substrate-binding protein [Pseudolabrys sp.]|nr:amino acid ABC transporter substrate-binding protein [Pseudolabrys sp.]
MGIIHHFGQHAIFEMHSLQILHRNLLTHILTRFFSVCAVVVFFIESFVVSLSAAAGTLDDVRSRDKLICGVSEGLPGFSEKDGSGVWRGFDVDFCKAVAAAVLGDTAKVEYVPLTADVRFNALTDRRIDLLSRNSTWTMSRELELGLEFVGISYFDGQGFLVPTLLGANSALQLDGARICVGSGTTSEQNAADFFQSKKLKVSFLRFTEGTEARAAYASEKCDVFTADRSALAAARSLLPVPQNHVILRDVISKEPLGPVTRKDDAKWTGLVRWTLFALINAEELGLDSKSIATSGRQRAIELGASATRSLGLANDWFVKMIVGVGNYAEIFERNLGENTPLALGRGVNALWTQGGLLYAPPMQ